ncbi:putative nitrogen fixation protein NifT [Vibrio olivae]|uniref:Nitrogen fixation protein NifT n=1 Tax=Vibrio olivae TaxID=1243002 RepID=A0ABV5HL43_9VIBR
MANVMIQYTEQGRLSLYLAKKDLEEHITRVEFESDDKWGGEIELANGAAYYVDPGVKPSFPISVRARRLRAAV